MNESDLKERIAEDCYLVCRSCAKCPEIPYRELTDEDKKGFNDWAEILFTRLKDAGWGKQKIADERDKCYMEIFSHLEGAILQNECLSDDTCALIFPITYLESIGQYPVHLTPKPSEKQQEK